MTPEKILVGTSVSFNLYPSQLDVRTEGLPDSSFKTFKNSRKANQDIFQLKDHVRDIHNSSHPKANMTFFILAVGRVKKQIARAPCFSALDLYQIEQSSILSKLNNVVFTSLVNCQLRC